MTESALTSVIAACQWFIKQKQTNDEAIVCWREMGDYIERMLPALESLNTQGLQVAPGILENLWQCIENAKRMYLKCRTGYSLWGKPWVTPTAIKEKAEVQTKKVREAFNDLLVLLNFVGHNHMVLHDQTASPTAGSNAAAAEAEGGTCGTWEIPTRDIELKLNMAGVPETVLGQGSFSVVGLGSYMGSPVAVKTAMPNVLAAAQKDSAVVRSFFREVKFMCSLDHPNICECHGAVTRKGEILLMWVVMEKLDQNLLEAIMGKHLEHNKQPPILEHGRDAPGPFADMVAGLFNAVTYLHGADQERPIVYRDLKPENIMLTKMNEFGRRVPKLVDFGESKETLHGVGSTVSKKGTPEWWSPEQKHRGGGCSMASDVYSLALVARFLWCGRRPSENEAGVVLVKEQTSHQLATRTLSLMNECFHPEAESRPSAASVSHQLSTFGMQPTGNDMQPLEKSNHCSELIEYLKGHFTEEIAAKICSKLGIVKTEDLGGFSERDIKGLELMDGHQTVLHKLINQAKIHQMAVAGALSLKERDLNDSDLSDAELSRADTSSEGGDAVSESEDDVDRGCEPVAIKHPGNPEDFQKDMQGFIDTFISRQWRNFPKGEWTYCMFVWIRFAKEASFDETSLKRWRECIKKPAQQTLLASLDWCLKQESTGHKHWSRSDLESNCSKDFAAAIYVTHLMVRHHLKGHAESIGIWESEVVKGWFENDEDDSAFLLRANNFLMEHLVNGIQVVETVVKTKSYVAFLRMSTLASLLLFEYLEVRKLEYNSS